ncbi:MAG: ester cyclase [bacterium]|nr:ester cyclase [bacterium]
MLRRMRIVSVVVACGAVFAGCSDELPPDFIEQKNMAIVRDTHAVLASGDFERFKAAIGPDYVRHCQAMPPALQELQGTEEFFAFLEEFLTAVPEYEDTLSQMIADGDRVAYVSTMTGIQIGPMGDLPATGKGFTLVNIIIQRLENGKIVETWVSWDNVAFLSQLGLMPSPGPDDS